MADAAKTNVVMIRCQKGRQIRMGVSVDEAGGTDELRDIQGPCGGRGGEVADCRNSARDDSAVGPHGRCAGAIDHRAIDECEIEVHALTLGGC